MPSPASARVTSKGCARHHARCHWVHVRPADRPTTVTVMEGERAQRAGRQHRKTTQSPVFMLFIFLGFSLCSWYLVCVSPDDHRPRSEESEQACFCGRLGLV